MLFNQSIINNLRILANKSNTNYKHAAVILMPGMKPICYSVNGVVGNKNYHAEFSVIDTFIKSYGFYYGLHKQWVLQGSRKVKDK